MGIFDVFSRKSARVSSNGVEGTSPHVFHLDETAPQDKGAGGYRIRGDRSVFPMLSGMSLDKVVLHRGGIREPHWHPNADELTYCLRGAGLVTIFGNKEARDTFMIEEGDVFYVPSGYFHHIENIADGESVFIVSFSHDSPEDFNLSSALGFQSDAALGNTWSVSQSVFKGLPRSIVPTFVAQRKTPFVVSDAMKYPSVFKYSLATAFPLVGNEGGEARVARQNVWPILKHQALYSLRVTDRGMREPHWHPETAELGYVTKGRGRMSVLSGDLTVDTYEMKEGDIYFIPEAYPHHIENLLNGEDLDILIFFNQAMPGDVSYSVGVRAYSNEVLGAVMNVDPSFFDQLKKPYEDAFIVRKIN